MKLRLITAKFADAMAAAQADIDTRLFYLTNRKARLEALAFEDFKAHGGDPASIERVEAAYGVTHGS